MRLPSELIYVSGSVESPCEPREPDLAASAIARKHGSGGPGIGEFGFESWTVLQMV